MSDVITLKKISQLLNISISTASRALKDHPDIADATKLKVKELAEMLEYEPNPYAIQLSTSHSNIFGLIVPEVSNLFYTSFIDAVEDESRKIGYTLIILKTDDDPDVEAAHIKYCKKQRVAGLFACITPNASNFDLFQSMGKSGIPVIFFDRVPPDNSNCNTVCFADETAASTSETNAFAHKITIMANTGMPNNNDRCGTISVVNILPHCKCSSSFLV